MGRAETGAPCSGSPQCPEGLKAQLRATADAQCQPQNHPDRSSALRLDASSNLRQLAQERGKAWRGVTGSYLAACYPKPADFGLVLWGQWEPVLARTRARGDAKGAWNITAWSLGTAGSMTDDIPGLATTGVRFDPRHFVSSSLFIRECAQLGKLLACFLTSYSPAKLGQIAKLAPCSLAHVSIEKLSLISCSLTCTGATHHNSDPRAPGLSFYLLRC